MNFLRKILLLIIPFSVFAQAQYSIEEVAEHNTPDDCWMVFEDSVYDFSEYLPDHDKFMDIREWCGKDMTEDFKTKADAGRDHKPFSYGLLDEYYIGSLATADVEIEEANTEEIVDTVIIEQQPESPYNLFLPLVLTLVFYWGSFFIFKKKYLKRFDGFWNTVLLLTFVIPSFGFGIYMMLQYRFPELRKVDFDFMYWHVELSVVMSVIALSHFVQRFKQYLVQIRK